MLEVTCDACGKPLQIGSWPFCPHESGSYGVIGDDIPGGVEIHHGLVNEDQTPMKFYSKSAIAREAKRRGLVNLVEHVTEPGTDKSKHTTRWI